MSFLKKSIPLSFCCVIMLVALLVTGCTREEQKQSLSNKRLGIKLTTEKGDRIALTNALTACLQTYFPDTEIIPLTAPGESVSDESDKNPVHNQVDYILDARLSQIAIKLSSPGLNISTKTNSGLKLQIGCYCELVLGYRLFDSSSRKTLVSGQCSGRSEDANRFQLKTGTVDIKIEEENEQSLIRDAMIDAVKNSSLSK